MTLLSSEGFRPFFLLAGLAAALLIPLWLVALAGHAPPGIDLYWHAHEMVFGYISAVLGGFFLTAVPKWTRSETIAGLPLMGLVGLWLLGRVARALLPGPAAAIDALFLLALALAIGVPIVRARSTRNALFPLLLLAMGAADIVGHFAPELLLPLTRAAALSALAIVVIFGGRITPLFTRNALGDPDAIRPRGWIDDAAITAVLMLIPLALVPVSGWLTAAVAGAGAALNLLRMRGWASLRTLGEPLLWILHAGYLWVALALAAWAVSAVQPGLVPPSAALHALTVGCLGTFTLGMMSRVSLGHTGRTLTAAPLVTAAYVAVLLAGLIRPLAAVAPWALHASGALWAAAFVLFLLVYIPILTRPRVKKG